MLKLAWRNVWRNRRRSLITIASMGFGLAAIMFGQSMIKSVQQQLVEKATASITGHLQVQHRNVKDYKFPDKYIDDPRPIEEAFASQPGLKAYAKRIIVTGLVSSPVASVGVLTVAIEPERERHITNMTDYLTRGEFLGQHARGIVMGEKLAQRLDLRLGEKAVVMAQAEDGSMGAEAFRIVGLYHTGSVSFDSQIIYIPLAAAQELLAVGPRVNKFVARAVDLEDADRIRQELADKLGGAREAQVLTWKQVDHEILGVQKFQNAILDIVLVIVFSIVALGILNTMLMSLFERVREFGVLMAMGANSRWIVRLILLESLALGLVGTLLGLVVGTALIAYYGQAGLDLPIGEALSYFLPFPSVIYLKFVWDSHLFATFAVLLTSALAAIPPALRACRLRPAEALRHV